MLSVIFQAEFGLSAEFRSRHSGCVCCASPQVQTEAIKPVRLGRVAKFFLIHFCTRSGCTFSTVTRKCNRKCISTAHDGVETWWSHTKSSFSSGGLAFLICSNFSPLCIATWRLVHVMGSLIGFMESNFGDVHVWAANRLSLHYRVIWHNRSARGQAVRHKFHGRQEVLCNCDFSVTVFTVKYCWTGLNLCGGSMLNVVRRFDSGLHMASSSPHFQRFPPASPMMSPSPSTHFSHGSASA